MAVESDKVTLTGAGASKIAKPYAEDCADSVSGVSHVQINLQKKHAASELSSGAGTQI